MTAHRGRNGPRVAISVFAAGALALGLAQPAVAQDEDLPWMDTSLSPEERAELLIDALTLEQKMQQIAMQPHDNEEFHDLEGCGFTRIGRHLEGIPELGIPLIRMINGPSGVGGGDCEPDPPATALPSNIGVASSFNPDNAWAWGDIGGAETRAGAHNVFLAPGLNMARVPHGGRNFEYYGEDPYLTGVMATQSTIAIQQHNVHANPKHFAFNEQETNRRTMNTIVPPRAAHEIYLLPFEMAVKDGEAASLMCSFPRIHGHYACENKELLTDTLRERWGFEGYVFSDRNATMSTVPSIKWGLDLEFPQTRMFAPDRLEMFMDAGRISEADFDRMLYNRYVQMFKFGLFENPVDDWGEFDEQAHGETARQIAEDGMVLLKNENDTLPLDADEIETIAIVGPEHFAGEAKLGPNSPNINSVVEAPYEIDPEEGIRNTLEALGSDAEANFYETDEISEAVEAAEGADVAIVIVGDLSVEGQDRPTLHLEDDDTYREGQDGAGVLEYSQEELISEVAAANPNTVVVLKNGGPILMPWIDEVPAVLEAFYPGQEDGNAVANVLFGVVNPSGKLPFTFPTSEREAAFATQEQFPGKVIDDSGVPIPDDPDFGDEEDFVREVTYSEDLEMGYRWYEANGVEPAFPFGFGLSYTTFEYSDLVVTPTTQPGRTALDVTFTITNTGDRHGGEAAQVYLTLPDEADQPSKRLVGFDKVYLDPGESETVTVTIDSTASNHPFSYFVPESDDWENDWAKGDWATADGAYTVHVARSVADVELEQTLDLTFTEGPGGGDEGEIPIEAEVPDFASEPGSLTLTIHEFGDSVDLGVGRRQVDRVRWDGDLPTVAVTDTRNDEQAGDSGWTVSGVAEDFTSDEDSFSAAYLGWLPWTTADDRPGVDAGPRIWGQMRGGPGLAEPQTLVSATSEGRSGAATAGAHLVLEVPLDTPPGEYRSAINLTLFPVD